MNIFKRLTYLVKEAEAEDEHAYLLGTVSSFDLSVRFRSQ